MDRITRKRLQLKVDYLGRLLKKDFAIDHYQPGGNPYVYKLVEQRWQGGSGVRDVHNYRMTTKEFYAYLNGMIDGVEQYATVGV